MNSELYDKSVQIPDEVITYLQKCYNAVPNANDSIEGFKRNKDLTSKKEITYQQLKRIKNWFDTFNGHQNDPSFILNGGFYMKNWVGNTLNSMRNNIYNTKKNRSEVLPNQFIDPYQKDDLSSMNRPSKSHKTSIDKYDSTIKEDLKRINELIKKII